MGGGGSSRPRTHAPFVCLCGDSRPCQDTRERVHIAIKTKLDASVLSRAKADEKFQSVVAEELAAIKNSIRVEAEVGRCRGPPVSFG